MLPAGIVTVSLKLPLPLAVKPVALPVVVLVYVTFVKAAGNVSATLAPETLLGPAFVTTIVYVIGVPGTAVVDEQVAAGRDDRL